MHREEITMTTRIAILAEGVSLDAELFNSACGNAIADALPLEAVPQVWGDEFYFEVPVVMPADETATVRVNVGDIGYWPPGNALAIFFRPTPLSTDERPAPAGEVNLVGRITGDATALRSVRGLSRIRVEKV